MQLKSLMRSLCAVSMAALMCAGTAQAALQDRDLDGNGVTDAFYDTDLNITWLRDANVNGLMNWPTAVSWANGLDVGGYTGWRLPTSDACTGFNCTGSEMGHLWYIALGNPAGGPTANKGGFLNLQTGDRGYYSGTELNAFWAFEFNMIDGNQGHFPKDGFNPFTGVKYEMYAMAVRDGDVTPVPEPATYALMLLGLAGLIAANRKR